jgi:hypothetical protein
VRLRPFALLSVIIAGAAGTSAPPDVGLWQSVLTNYVTEDGNVRYAALKGAAGPLKTFVAQIGEVSPSSHPALFPSRQDKLAYWLNAYNALVLDAIVAGYPDRRDRLSSLLGRGIFFKLMKVRAGGRATTLDAIETSELREGFHDPRIHFAIVCASRGCPWLGRTAFTVANVDSLLNEGARRFLNQQRNVNIDLARHVVTMSSIFTWFGTDFGSGETQRLQFIARYRDDGAKLLSQSWTLRYADWDWSLNDAGR